MSQEINNSLLSLKKSTEAIVTQNESVLIRESSYKLEDGQTPLRSTEDSGAPPGIRIDEKIEHKDREMIFVIVDDSSCISNPSSRELLIDEKVRCEVLRKHCNKNVQPIDMPSTSRDFRNDFIALRSADSSYELQMVDINLQSENEIAIEENEADDSIVMSYLRTKDANANLEATAMLSSKMKSSILEDVPKMETIVEGERFSAFSGNRHERLSETSLDVHIPSYPGSPRSFHVASRILSNTSFEERGENLRKAVNFLHEDNVFFEAAELGNYKTLEVLLSKGVNRHQCDHLGRNALHLAVCSGNQQAITLLLKAGINANIKDNLGMTPLSLCLMRSPSVQLAKLLFAHGAKILPRVNPMDTGLFLQFVMMCEPTEEEEKLLELLVSEGALINDNEAPGGRQALHIAALSNNCPLIEILLNLGANVFATNHTGETPKEFAMKFKCKEAAALLRSLEDVGSQSIHSISEEIINGSDSNSNKLYQRVRET